MRFKILSILIVFTLLQAQAQQPATSAEVVQKALLKKAEGLQNSIVKALPFKNIGPTVMSGRVTDIAVNPENPNEFYVAYASGGLWHSTNNGTSFTPILDSALTQNIGDIAVEWKSRTLWVGTGENNSSRSSYAGIGLLKSTNNGATWEHAGLADSHHIGRILINPNNPQELVVGVTGHLYSANSERGIYKTKDGGKTWSQTLFVDDKSGIIDLQMTPDNFNLLFAASWTKDRKAWNFDGSGNNSGIYKSTDAGETWTRLTTKKSGFPIGSGVGRIGLAIADDNTIYAIHDSQFRRPSEAKKEKSRGLVKEDFKSMTQAAFLKLTDKRLNVFLKLNGFQEKYRAENVKQLVRNGHVKPVDLATYLEDANSMLFDTPVIGAEIYKSTDGGKTWQKTHKEYLDDLYYSYGYYFGHIYVSPQHKDHIYVYGVPILKSKDGGQSFVSISKENVHADHHALWINPKDPNHLIDGNDGGLNISYDDGEHWIKNNSPAVGQFYAINVDNQQPYHVYGGLQDNGVWTGPHNAKESRRWHQTGQYPWESIMGGDGMQIEIDSRNADIVYTGYQFGNYYRINRSTNEQHYIQPKHELSESPYRFNWQTPIQLSVHNQDILYLGGNKLMRSMNQGEDWKAISSDLTQGGKKGNVAYGTLTSISESPFDFGLIYTGSDDGLIHITKDSGATWDLISTNLPKDLWVSRVIASRHKKERVYVTLNGYRWDDFTTYVYKSDDYGKTWTAISSNLPMSPVNVIREDYLDANLLYLGTDNGAYVSFDKGDSWAAFSNGLPAVAVHDMVLHKTSNDLLIGTHGRSIYKANIEVLRNLDKQLTGLDSRAINLYDMASVKYSSRWGSSWSKWFEASTPESTIVFYAKTEQKQNIQILSEQNTVLNNFEVETVKGFNYVDYDLSITEKGRKALLKENTSIDINKSKNGLYYLPKGKYKILVGSQKTNFQVE